MINRAIFYIQYAFRGISRGGRWTTLAILAIAAGVATVVALRSLGLAIGDTLTENVRIVNKGDIALSRGSRSPISFLTRQQLGFSETEINRVREWVDELGGEMTVFMSGQNSQVTAQDFSTFGRPQFVSSYFINPDEYPLSHDIVALDPAGVPLSELFTGGREVVISENLAQSQGIAVGEEVRVSNTEELFVVRGIVSTANEANTVNPFAAFFGFAYFDLDVVTTVLNSELNINNISINLPEGATYDEIEAAETTLMRNFYTRTSARITTVPELLEAYSFISQILGDFIVTLGLGALLIGGVGIMNTMLVMVRRRTKEIAALKTFGLKGGQVARLFFTEAFILGLIGCLIGMVMGIFFSYVVKQYGEAIIQQPLSWRIYPEALLYGFVLGMIFTVIFGVAPILTAIKVRPGIILRPNETYIPALGVIQWLAMILFVTVTIGLIVGQIIAPSVALFQDTRLNPPSPYLIGVLAVAGTFLFIGVLVCFLWLIVWLVSKSPTFGSIDIQLALRNLSNNRLRTAMTLLALSAGMFALSSITFIGEGARELLSLRLADQFGGNVLVFPLPLVPSPLAESAINNALADVDVQYETRILAYGGVLYSVDGKVVTNPLAGSGGDFGDAEAIGAIQWSNIQVYDTDNPDFTGGRIVAGRALTPDDVGQNVLVGPAGTADMLGVRVGSKLEYRMDGRGRIEFEVVGLVSEATGFGFNSVTVPAGTLDRVTPEFRLYTYMVPSDQVNTALVELSAIPLLFSLDVSFIDQLLSRLIEQFAAIPTAVGLLSLFAAGVIMANTVALGTLERRQQIGIFKALGLSGKRVLTIMLIETTLVGLLSALIGLGLSSLIVTFFTSVGGLTIPLPADARLLAFGLVITAVAIGWIATFLSAQVAVRERVLNVLRYE